MDALCSARGQANARVAYALLARVLRGLNRTLWSPREPWVVAELALLLPELGVRRPKEVSSAAKQRAVAQTSPLRQSRLAGLVVDDVQFADDASLEDIAAADTQETIPTLPCLTPCERMKFRHTYRWKANCRR